MKLAGTCNKVCPLSTRIINIICTYIKTRRERVARCFNQTKRRVNDDQRATATTINWQSASANSWAESNSELLVRLPGSLVEYSSPHIRTQSYNYTYAINQLFLVSVIMAQMCQMCVCVCKVVWERIRESTCWASQISYLQGVCLSVSSMYDCVCAMCLIESNRAIYRYWASNM